MLAFCSFDFWDTDYCGVPHSFRIFVRYWNVACEKWAIVDSNISIHVEHDATNRPTDQLIDRLPHEFACCTHNNMSAFINVDDYDGWAFIENKRRDWLWKRFSNNQLRKLNRFSAISYQYLCLSNNVLVCYQSMMVNITLIGFSCIGTVAHLWRLKAREWGCWGPRRAFYLNAEKPQEMVEKIHRKKE